MFTYRADNCGPRRAYETHERPMLPSFHFMCASCTAIKRQRKDREKERDKHP